MTTRAELYGTVKMLRKLFQDIREGCGSPPAGALESGSPSRQHRDSNPGSAVPGGEEDRSSEDDKPIAAPQPSTAGAGAAPSQEGVGQGDVAAAASTPKDG